MIEKLGAGVQPKADIFGLVHPMYSLTLGDYEEYGYKHTDKKTGNVTEIVITPSADFGRATIDDRDLLIYVMTLVKVRYDKESYEENSREPKPISFEAHDFFKYIDAKGTKRFEMLELTLKRLKDTKYTINTCVEGEVISCSTQPFTLLSQADFNNKRSGQGSRNNTTVTITLNEWLHKAIITSQLLQLHPDYFKLRPFEKRTYELARKFCGSQGTVLMGLDKMVAYFGSKQPKRHIKAELKIIATRQPLPEYDIKLESGKNNSTNIRFMRPRNKKSLIYETMPVKENIVPATENGQEICYEDLFVDDDPWEALDK
ncbi:MAG: hypothetical protein A2X82_04360 [Geobacteraceae bacterium GWC2_55_20]|nr:MAG: hypothetical protein A2X82_04360 [Geobacteraceae bacterium GWC2_55_20]OGU25000.1 MAG: hypothetical protein A2X85_11615 [Geobacteraceae bacterium GWF2_54_21]HCE67384.1 hypothetical protein [Geobacter sp.]